MRVERRLFPEAVSRILTETLAKSATKFDWSSCLVSYRYRAQILDALSEHGLAPGPTTAPNVVRDAVNDLYRYEIRRLRDALLAGRIPKPEYASHVIELRKRYLVLSVPLASWLEPSV
jgi:hypothetical protein